jgi:hypothetical protein
LASWAGVFSITQKGKADGTMADRLKTDPRTEAIMWIGVSCPLVYGVAKQGFNISTGGAAVLAALWGGGLWSMQSGLMVNAWKSFFGATQTKGGPPSFTVHFDSLNQ